MVSVISQPEGVHHYDTLEDVPWDIQKYWHQRQHIFSLYDEGIWMTDDAWFGVTPEPVAITVADHVAQFAPEEKTILIDAFAGAGGNTIAFAQSDKWEHIYAIEKDPKVLACAQHNAAIYGVQDKITWIHGDCFEELKSREFGPKEKIVIFASPPWGGPGYSSDQVFSLKTMQPYNLQALMETFQSVTSEVVLYLPRTSDLNQLAEYVTGKKIHVTHYCMKGASKALCAYFGTFS